jgi:hypothetical protein
MWLETDLGGAWGDLSSDRGKPTIELRTADSAGSPRLVAEYLALAIGFVSDLARSEELDQAREVLEARLLETIDNRTNASRHGLQATLLWHGEERRVVELLADMLDRAEAGLQRFGTSGAELTLLRCMLATRQTQADMLLALRPHHDDPLVFAEACLQVLREPAAFETYLRAAPELPVLPRLDAGEQLWHGIGERTPFDALRHELRWPPAVLERRLQAMADDGRVRLDTDPFAGPVVSRL